MKSYRRKDHLKEENSELHRQRIIAAMHKHQEEQSKMLNEMALPLKEYTKRIDDVMYQLAENWCLCKWCQLFDPENDNFNHWKEELSAYVMKLASPKLKNNIGKKKHLEKHLVEWYDLDEKDMVIDVIDFKFDKEHIMDNSQREVVANAFATSIHKLIDAISSGIAVCKTYLAKEFSS